jgi:DNA-binding NarL/FixJ family response regulator
MIAGVSIGGVSTGGVLRILMADDHPIVLAGLKALVEADPGLEIVGEARDGRTALRLALSLRPDVIVMDISMPEMNGIEVARALLAEHPDFRVLMLTVHEDRATLRQLLDLGVAGYLVKRSRWRRAAPTWIRRSPARRWALAGRGLRALRAGRPWN